MMNKMNKKGFTLIELLAVIVIMGILMIIAIPLMTRYIENSRRDTFIQSGRTFINAARYQFLGGEMTCSGQVGNWIIPISEIMIDGNDLITNSGSDAGVRSSFGNNNRIQEGYVRIQTENDGTSTYYVGLRDNTTNRNGFPMTVEGRLDTTLRNTTFSNSLTTFARPAGLQCCLAGRRVSGNNCVNE